MTEKKLMLKCVISVVVTTAKTLKFVKIMVVVCGATNNGDNFSDDSLFHKIRDRIKILDLLLCCIVVLRPR